MYDEHPDVRIVSAALDRDLNPSYYIRPGLGDMGALKPVLCVDLEVKLRELTKAMIAELDIIKPFGPENPEPIFVTRGILMRDNAKLLSRSGVKLWIRENNFACEAVSFFRTTNKMAAVASNTAEAITGILYDSQILPSTSFV
jgi:hypothetical protein